MSGDAPVMIAWLGNAAQDDLPSWSHRWVHMFTYPRELHLRNGKIFQRPVPQLNDAMEMKPLYREEEKGKLVELKNALTFRLRVPRERL